MSSTHSQPTGPQVLGPEEGGLNRISAACPPSFYMYPRDPHANYDMIEGLENHHKVEECSFNTIFGIFQGYKIFGCRKVAEKEINLRDQFTLGEF